MITAQKFAIVLWVVAGIYFLQAQYAEPFLQKGLLDSAAGLQVMLRSLYLSFYYAGTLVALGAVFHLLGEIRDAIAAKKAVRLAAKKFAAFIWIGALVVVAHSLVGWTTMRFQDVSVVLVLENLLWAAGPLVMLGAIIWLLGDIRDRLVPAD